MTKTITISDETYESIKGQLTSEEKIDVSSLEDFVGKKLFIRTVTYHSVGRVVRIMGNLMELENASWVADSGRFMDAIKNGTLNEVEPVGQQWININSVVDIFPWAHKLPTQQK